MYNAAWLSYKVELKFVWLPASTTLRLCSLQLCDSNTMRSYENQIEKEVLSLSPPHKNLFFKNNLQLTINNDIPKPEHSSEFVKLFIFVSV